MADATLAAIRTKVRRLTRNPSTAQLTDAAIDEYVDTFIAYDLPEQLRLFTLRRNFSFYTQPNVDQYETTAGAATDPLFNFKNVITTVHTPVYINGYQARFTLSQSQFYGIYPKLNTEFQIGTGDGVTTNFTATVTPTTILQGSVVINGISATNNASDVFIDDPQNGQTGNLIVPNDPAFVFGTINYLTGAVNINFVNAPASGESVNMLYSAYTAARPDMILFFDNKFFIRPVPDQSYKVEMEVYKRPTEMLEAGDMPKLAEWWQYIAYLSAKKVFEDRMDLDSVQLILPELKEQEALILRRTIVQNTTQRVATIYSQDTSPSGSYGNNGWSGGGGFF